MIARYTRPGMAALWSEEAKLRTWLDVEVLACEGWAKIGQIPVNALQVIQEKAQTDRAAIEKLEQETGHDVAAFVSYVQSHLGDAGRYFHMGLTSSDIVDTALSYRLVKAIDLLLESLQKAVAITQQRALQDKAVPTVGRTHGIHAEPMTMGLKWLRWHTSLQRALERLTQARTEVAIGKLSGVVGTYSQVPPEVEAFVCKALGLTPETVATQVIPRDRLASFFFAIATLGAAVEGIAVEIRHLQRTEVGEVREGFGSKQKGSSAMPHKRNPILSENLTGLSRLLRSYVAPALENCALWHERDISHSSVERVLVPDACTVADFLLARLQGLLQNLEVFPEKMAANLRLLQGVNFSQKVLLHLLDKGLTRDEAYGHVQRCCFLALEENTPLEKILQRDPATKKHFTDADLKHIFAWETYLHAVDGIYQRVLSHA